MIFANLNSAITKNGITKLATAPALDVEKYQSKTDKKLVDEEILKILEEPIAKPKKAKK